MISSARVATSESGPMSQESHAATAASISALSDSTLFALNAPSRGVAVDRHAIHHATADYEGLGHRSDKEATEPIIQAARPFRIHDYRRIAAQKVGAGEPNCGILGWRRDAAMRHDRTSTCRDQ
jgi:hypothetical protein